MIPGARGPRPAAYRRPLSGESSRRRGCRRARTPPRDSRRRRGCPRTDVAVRWVSGSIPAAPTS